MASSTVPPKRLDAPRERARGDVRGQRESWLREVLAPLASLKLTVVLFALAIFLVLAGTLAQVEKDIWQVVEEYFRSALVWIDLRVFFPPSFFPGFQFPHHLTLPGGRVIPLGFHFPGGWLIGAVLAVNLIMAHAVRFKAQGRGLRLVVGSMLIGVGSLLTWAVIADGSSSGSETAASLTSYAALWRLIQAGLALGSVALLWTSLRGPGAGSAAGRLGLVGALGLAGLFAWTLSSGGSAPLGDSSLRIIWQLTKGQAAALILLIGCVLVFKKRAGIVLLHGGIGLMMAGEVLTGLTAVEGHIQLLEGETSGFVRHSRTWELAVVDTSRPDVDVVTAIPESRLLGGERVEHELLPFDVKLIRYLPNSTIRPAGPRESNPATSGIGTSWIAEPTRPVSGTDGGRVNQPAGYVTFYRKGGGEELGTHLVGLSLAQVGLAERVEVDGKTYEVSLRNKRTYKPYSITLKDVQKEDYPGTEIPRHYASQVRLVDESRQVDRDVKIWMNNPLRYAGETFYQSGYARDPESGREASTLAVVSNAGWLIPYVGCMLVATGMLAQFAGGLLRFLGRRTDRAVGAPERAQGSGTGIHPGAMAASPTRMGWLLPILVVGVSGLWVLGRARPASPPREGLALYQFGELPVIDQGRAKPLDTLARNSLQALSNRQTFIDAEGRKQPAIRWLLDLITRPQVAEGYEVFRIENTELLDVLGLEPRAGFRYALGEFAGRIEVLREEVERAAGLDPAALSVFQKKSIELDRKLGIWNLLIRAFVPPKEMLREGHWALSPTLMPARPSIPLIVPADTEPGEWLTYVQGLARLEGPVASDGSTAARVTRAFGESLAAYRDGDTERFNRALGSYRRTLAEAPPVGLDAAKPRYEAYYNHLDPCFIAAALYLGAFVLAAVAWLAWREPLNRTAFGVTVLAWIVHTLVMASRIYISGRPPVTNLYSSALFIGWAAVLFGLGMERLFRMGIGTVTAAVAGFSTLLIAYFLGSDGDTFAVLQAVLDTQFWLATHVVCITLGYSATYVAGLLGIIYILRGVLTRSLSPDAGRTLSRMIYGTTCFALLFSFVGTVLGGLWADDSWGRFWGWDPKENGALMIVLWNALVLHARWGALIKQRGLAMLAVAGNIVVSWSWFGVNELGIGLHSYGFTEGVLRSLGLFVVSQILIIALALLPPGLWRSRPTASPV